MTCHAPPRQLRSKGMKYAKIALILILFVSSTFASAAQKVQLALNWKAEPEFGGFYAAQINGAYKKQGLEVEVMQGGAGTPVVQMLASGKAEFGIVSADEVVIARSRGADVVALFAAYQTNPQGIMAHAERGFKTMADVFKADGALGMQKGLPYAQFLFKKFKDVKARIVPYTGGVATFLTDAKFSQQCFVTSEPFEAEKKGAKVKAFLVADEGFNPYTTVLAARGDLLKKDPKLVKAMVEAVRAGWKEYIAHPEAANKVMAELNKSMDAAVFKEIATAQLPLLESSDSKANGVGHMTEERWKTLTRQLLDLKVIDKAPGAKEMFTNL